MGKEPGSLTVRMWDYGKTFKLKVVFKVKIWVTEWVWVEGGKSRWSGLICEGGNWIWRLSEMERNKTADKNLWFLHRKHNREWREATWKKCQRSNK